MKTFKPIKELDAAFENARPKLLGSLLGLLVKTLKEMKHLPVDGKFRMANFAHFGRAMTVALRRDADFSRKARKCQANWYRRIDQALLRKGRKRCERELDFWSRQKAYTGVLIIDGKPIPPHDWTAMEAKAT
ncbi:MAG: hypothetical protein QM501_00760 [Gimesia sp.]